MRCVYVIRNVVNGKIYVGQTKNFEARKTGHFYAAKTGLQRPLYHSMRKHGIENFSFECIEECADELINEREQFWVTHFDSFNPEKGYNLTSGGGTGCEVAESTKLKLSEMFSGEKNPMFGKKIPKLSEFNKARVGPLNHNFGKPNPWRSERNRKALGAANPMFGKRASENPNSKLSMEQVQEILTLLSTTTLSNKKIGLLYNVSKQTIMRIRNGTSSYVQHDDCGQDVETREKGTCQVGTFRRFESYQSS